MNTYWSRDLEKINAYVPGEQPKDKRYIKLNTNENPYPPSPKVLDRIKSCANEDLRLYPDPACEELRKTIAEYYKLNKSQVFVGNGSDEILAFSFIAFFKRDLPILFPDITYSFYPVYCQIFSIPYALIPLDDKFNIPTAGFKVPSSGVILPNPNAPTGRAITLREIEDIANYHRDMASVIIDEAYVDFGAESAVKLISLSPNLLIVQTFSKSRSLAGLRVGFALGNEVLIQGLEKVKNSFNSYTLGRPALAGASEAIKDNAYFQEVRARIIRTREKTSQQLSYLGFIVIPSEANFIFVSHPLMRAESLFQKLRDRGVLVRYFKLPRIDNYLRVTIGLDEEMDAFIETTASILSEHRMPHNSTP